eukprot:3260943-Alexandrium_andersonii.AAC.1
MRSWATSATPTARSKRPVRSTTTSWPLTISGSPGSFLVEIMDRFTRVAEDLPPRDDGASSPSGGP